MLVILYAFYELDIECLGFEMFVEGFLMFLVDNLVIGDATLGAILMTARDPSGEAAL